MDHRGDPQAKYPEWRVWDSWILSKLYGGSSKGGALEVDQYQATHPIEVAVNHPSEVQEIFDDLSASVPRTVPHHGFFGDVFEVKWYAMIFYGIKSWRNDNTTY